MILAWLVHAFTASGAVCAFLSVLAATQADLRRAFLWLVAATLIDSVDGALARRARVNDRIPRFNGARLDDIVDYLTFVFVPAFILHHAGYLPDGTAGVLTVAAVLLSSAYGFSREDAKTADHFFTGFPSYWNIVAVYMTVAKLPQPVNAAILVLLAGMVFVPIGYVYPSRTPQLRALTLALGAIWGVLFVAMIALLPAPPGWLVKASCVFPAYYFVLSFILHARRSPARR